MTFWEAEKNKKPDDPGEFDPGLVAPEQEWFWNKRPTVVVPLWERIGDKSRNLGVVANKVITHNGGTWESGPKGIGQRYNATSESSSIGHVTPVVLPLTLITYCRTFTGGHGIGVSITESGSLIDFLYLISNNSDNEIQFHFRTGGINPEETDYVRIGSGSAIDTANHLIIATSRTTTDHELFLDGVSVGTSTVTITPSNIIEDRSDIGALHRSSVIWSGDIIVYYTAIIPDSFSSSEAAKLARDPFGPFRMDEEEGFFVPAVVSAPIINLVMASYTPT